MAFRENVEFSTFVTTVIFETLGRLPTSFEKDFEKQHMQSIFCNSIQLIHRILKSTESTIPFPIVIIALRYIHRLAQSKSNNPCFGSEAHIFLFALIAAQKSFADNCFTNATWSKISKTPAHALMKMEFEFLTSLDYDLNVSQSEYVNWFTHVQHLAKQYKVIKTKEMKKQCVEDKFNPRTPELVLE